MCIWSGDEDVNKDKRVRDEESLWEEMKSLHLEQRDSKMSDARAAT